MTGDEIARHRLQNQQLVAPTGSDPAEIVRLLGAVQSQDYPNAKWAIGQRCSATDDDIEGAFAAGRIVRTHLLRPTWHFVTAEDIRWLLALTASRVSAGMASYNRRLELDARVFRKSNAVIVRTLRDGQQKTRAELAEELYRSGVNVSTGQHVAHLLMQAELDGVVCSGARRGKQFTYALLDERVPAQKARERDESLADLVQRYFATRGPATLHDFAWWSGLTIADAKRGIQAARGSEVVRVDISGREHWLMPSALPVNAARTAHLLPNYDEYFIGFKDRSAIARRLRKTVTKPRTDALMGHVIVVDGQLIGGWRRTIGNNLTIELEPLVALSRLEDKLVLAEAERMGRFLGLPVRTAVVGTKVRK